MLHYFFYMQLTFYHIWYPRNPKYQVREQLHTKYARSTQYGVVRSTNICLFSPLRIKKAQGDLPPFQRTVKIFILGRNKTGTPQKIVDCSSFVPYQHCFGGVSVPCKKKRGVRRIFFSQRCTMHLGGVGMGIKILPQQNCSGPEQNWDTPKNPKCSSFVPVQYTSVSE